MHSSIKGKPTALQLLNKLRTGPVSSEHTSQVTELIQRFSAMSLCSLGGRLCSLQISFKGQHTAHTLPSTLSTDLSPIGAYLPSHRAHPALERHVAEQLGRPLQQGLPQLAKRTSRRAVVAGLPTS